MQAKLTGWEVKEHRRFLIGAATTRHVEYTLDVTYGPTSWTMTTRYSELLGLHDALLADPELEEVRPPVFPAKETGKKNLEPGFVDQRMTALNAWLYDLLLDQRVASHPLIHEFFRIAEHAGRLASPRKP